MLMVRVSLLLGRNDYVFNNTLHFAVRIWYFSPSILVVKAIVSSHKFLLWKESSLRWLGFPGADLFVTTTCNCTTRFVSQIG